MRACRSRAACGWWRSAARSWAVWRRCAGVAASKRGSAIESGGHAAAAPRPAVLAAGLTLLAAIACLYRIDAPTLWNDEAFSFFVSQRGVAETLALVNLDTQPPLYYLALTAWLRLGHDPFVLRALSAASIVVATPLLFGATRRLLGVQVAILACVLFAVDGNVLYWAQRARPYALQTMFAALMFWGFAGIWTADAGRPGWRAWVAYVLGGAAGVLTQYPVGFMLVGVNAAVAWRILGDFRRHRGLLGRWVVAQVALAAACSVWLVNFLHQASGDLNASTIEARHSIYLVPLRAVLDALVRLFSVPALWSLQLPFLAVFGVAALLGVGALVRRGQAGVPVLAVLGVALGIWLLGWRFVHPIFGYVSSSSVWFVLPYVMLLAAGVRSLPRWAGAGLMAALCAGDMLGLANLYRLPSVPLEQAAAALRPLIAPGDAILFGDQQSGRWGLAYYLGPPYAGRLRGLDLLDTTNFLHVPDPGQKVGWLVQGPGDTAGVDRLWVFTPANEMPLADPAVVLPGGHEAYRMAFPGLSLRRFDR